ncbi:formylglycine-generating enzyme family protein [Gelidibacter maritimus]|uniref:Formylglycine-generating enzyme family protein n=1 Tax=Gelidibacter maritimus TaxID=2761487 RepID=A0A7W2M4Y2_9FLAO|nr:formylglycine-generating enzyme family protein [Gelidibacter maritimus]MBA6152797.1 formylglycine-generating enzyme family protein [Gelidibacter maritimus]
MKISFLLSLLLLILQTSILLAQEEQNKNYTQDIAGSELTIEMVAIPKGEFIMGSSENEKHHYEDEAPQHKVAIDGFWMSKYEITWDLYNLFVNRTIDKIESSSKATQVTADIDAISGATVPYVDMSLGMGSGSDLPVGNVTHHAASKFCEWLSAKTGRFYRLPTEAEWEYAARAGTTTAYHFGDDETMLDEYAWYYDNSKDTYHKVGQKKPNPWGLYDMYGNVAEWTLDQYLPTVYERRTDLTHNPIEFPIKEYPHAVRGGSYYDDAEYLRSAARLGSTENWKMRDPQFPKSKWWHTDAPFVGFRIVSVPHPPKETDYEKYWGPKSH